MMFLSIAVCTGLLGLFIAFPLMLLAGRRPANLWLGLFVFALSWLALADLYWRQPLLLFGVFDWPLAAIGAFYYLYVRGLVGLGNGRAQLWHFLPLAAWSALLLAGRLNLPPQVLKGYLLSPAFGVLLLGFEALAGAYAIAVLVRLRQYRRRVRANYSSELKRDLGWLSWLSALLLALLLIWIPANLFGGAWGAALYFGRLLILYFVGWYGLRQAAVIVPAPAAPDKYARSGMSEAARQLIGERLARRLELRRDFLDSDVSLAELAERLGTSPQLLSQYLNDVLGQNFFDYINALRVAEVQRLLRASEHAGRGLLELAFAAGFNSKSTFNAAFKKIAGLPPSEWRKQQVPRSGPIGQDASAPGAVHTGKPIHS
ncbi:MAG: helix-turn-helix domain-containing protein [Pseudomonadota bacterium]